MSKIKIWYMGFPGHTTDKFKVHFHLNTILTYYDHSIVISTIGPDYTDINDKMLFDIKIYSCISDDSKDISYTLITHQSKITTPIRMNFYHYCKIVKVHKIMSKEVESAHDLMYLINEEMKENENDDS